MTKRALVVEDNDRNRKLLRTILAHHGYEVVECETAAPSLELAREHGPSIVLMDIELPGMDGIAALARLRADPATAHIPVIAVTASVTGAGRERVAAAGFDACIGKPIDVDAFTATVAALTGEAP
jgi:two-component system cell cycle response regulator DivK